MTRPGDSLRRLASRFCASDTMERLVDPILADLQAEHAAAVADRRLWTARIVRLGGIARLFQSLCLHTLTAPALRRGRETVAVGAAAFAASVAIYVGPVLRIQPLRPNANVVELAIYPVPGAVPAGLALAMLCGAAHGLSSEPIGARRLRRLLAFSLVPALVSFAASGWVMPAANQAFRFAAAGHPIARGVNELSLGELRALLARTSEPMLIVGPHTLRVVDAAYQARWMLGCLPFLTAAFGASVARRRPIVRVLAAVGFIVAYNAHFVVFLHQQDGGALVSGTAPVWLLVWAPNAMLAVVAGTLLAVDARLKPRAPSGSLRSPNP